MTDHYSGKGQIMEQSGIITREEQREEDTWNLQDLYENETLYEEDVRRLEGLMDDFGNCRGTLRQGAAALLRALLLYEEMNMIYEKLIVYANQRYHEDTANAKYQSMSGRAQILGTRLGQAVSWLEPELLALEPELLDGYFAAKTPQDDPARENGGSPDAALDEDAREQLAGYRRFVETITRRREHVLDARTEELLARAWEIGQAPDTIFSMFNNADIRFPEVTGEDGKKFELTLGRYPSCLESRGRNLRKEAFEALHSVYGQFQNTLAATYYANARQADFFAKEHRYANAMEEALDAGPIPVSVYENLIKTVNAHLPLLHRYVSLRKKLLGLEELHMYDVYVPLEELPEKRYSFEEAKEIVMRALAPLGEDYLELLQEGFGGRWIDIYENKGKRTGAYSWGAYGTHPYVLLNYHGRLNDVFTLAHEMGHALHSCYSDRAQKYLYAGYKIFVAEVASTCNEALLIHDLIGRSTDESEKRYLVNYFLDQFRATMFRQTMFAEFEMETHRQASRGETLTAEGLCGQYLELNRRYFGKDMVSDPPISFEWSRIPHFYSPFYVYQYATGFAAAVAISSKILNGEPGIVEKYKEFLSGGCSKDPIDLLKICGVDMSEPGPVEEALNVFEKYLEFLSK